MIKLKELAQKFFLFVQMSASGFVGCFAVAVVSLFSLDLVKAARIVDLMISVTAGVGVSGAKRAHTSYIQCALESEAKEVASQVDRAIARPEFRAKIHA